MSSKKPSKEQVRSIVEDDITEQYTREESRLTRTALDRLHLQLVDAAKIYESEPTNQRQAVCDALIATSEFLEKQGFNDATLVPLSRVIVAMVDLCRQNRPDPLFCEKLKVGKPRRSLEDSIRQGHLAALADAWLEAYSNDEGGTNKRLARAARHMSGKHFGKVTREMLGSARSYQRQTGHNALVYDSHKQMKDVLNAEAKVAGGGECGLRTAIDVQIKALNIKAKMR